MRKLFGGLVAVALAAGATLAPAAAQELRFGALYPFSGGLALLGDESFRGLEVAVEERNAAGGISGKRIRLSKGDAVDQNQAIGEARRLMSVERVEAIFGTYASPLSFAATQVAELAGTPYFELGAISDPITERGFKYLFRTCPTSMFFGQATVDAVAAIGDKLKVDPKSLRVAILHEDALYGTTVSNFQKEHAKKLGLNVVETLSYSAKSVDLSSVVQRLRGANADIVLHTGYHNDIVLFYRGMNEAGWKPKAVIGAGAGYSLTDTAKALGDLFEGTLNVDFTQYETNEKAAPGIKGFVAAYEKKYGHPPRSGHSLANYMGARVFFDVIAKAGSMDKDKIRAAVMAVEIPRGSTPTGWGVKFDDKGQNQNARPFLMQWQGGKLVTVFPNEAAVADFKVALGR